MSTKKKPKLNTLSVSTVTTLGSMSDLSHATPQSAAVLMAGGSVVPLGLSRPRSCRICQNPARGYIEQWLSRRWSIESINLALDERLRITRDNVDTHLRGCMETVNGLNILRAWAESQDGETPTSAARMDRVIDNMISDAEQAVDSGQIQMQLKPADVIALAKIVQEREAAKAGSVGQEVFEQIMVEYFDVLRSTTTVEQQKQIAKALEANPILRALAGRTLEPTIVESQAVLATVGSGGSSWNTEGFEG